MQVSHCSSNVAETSTFLYIRKVNPQRVVVEARSIIIVDTKNIVDKDWNRLVQRRRGQDSDKVNLADRARKMGPREKNNKDLYLAFRSSDTTDSHDARGRYR